MLIKIYFKYFISPQYTLECSLPSICQIGLENCHPEPPLAAPQDSEYRASSGPNCRHINI